MPRPTAKRIRAGGFAPSPGYFAALGVPIVAGRDFNASDDRRVAGVLAFSVSGRTREFGVCLAIGSTPRHLLTRILGRVR